MWGWARRDRVEITPRSRRDRASIVGLRRRLHVVVGLRSLRAALRVVVAFVGGGRPGGGGKSRGDLHMAGGGFEQ